MSVDGVCSNIPRTHCCAHVQVPRVKVLLERNVLKLRDGSAH
jgi:hypothetical protein